jgi:hypothetical protein
MRTGMGAGARSRVREGTCLPYAKLYERVSASRCGLWTWQQICHQLSYQSQRRSGPHDIEFTIRVQPRKVRKVPRQRTGLGKREAECRDAFRPGFRLVVVMASVFTVAITAFAFAPFVAFAAPVMSLARTPLPVRVGVAARLVIPAASHFTAADSASTSARTQAHTRRMSLPRGRDVVDATGHCVSRAWCDQ